MRAKEGDVGLGYPHLLDDPGHGIEERDGGWEAQELFEVVLEDGVLGELDDKRGCDVGVVGDELSEVSDIEAYVQGGVRVRLYRVEQLGSLLLL
jgi:hypothetical protein